MSFSENVVKLDSSHTEKGSYVGELVTLVSASNFLGELLVPYELLLRNYYNMRILKPLQLSLHHAAQRADTVKGLISTELLQDVGLKNALNGLYWSRVMTF